MGGRMGGRSGRKGKQSGRTAETPHRHSEDSQNAGLNHAAGEEKNDNPAPEKPDGTEVEAGSGNRGSAQKTMRNQRTIISVCPSALTLCDARQ